MAVVITRQARKASPSFIQRKLHIGYNLAADLIMMMEVQGIISAPKRNGHREVLKP